MRQERSRARRLPGVFRAFCTLVLFVAMLAGCSGEKGESGNGEQDRSAEPKREWETTEEQRETLVESMSLREAVGQMFVVSVGGAEAGPYIERMVRERNIGGVMLFGYNMESEVQTKRLVSTLQETAMGSEPAVPLFVAVDQEGGRVASAPWVTPQPAAARVESPREASEIAYQIGTELLPAGINVNLAPVADTGFGAAIGSRSFGEDPERVSRMVASSVRGYEAAGIVSSAKHFPNHGVAGTDSHLGLPVIQHGMQTIRSYDLPPFEEAIDADVPMVMMGHLLYPAIDPENPASLSPAAYEMLREELGFDGVAVADDLAMDAVSGGRPPSEAAVQAVAAGADLLIISNIHQKQVAAYEAVVEAVESGEIPREEVYDSAERILEVKREYLPYEIGGG